jgi:hypothetical protein
MPSSAAWTSSVLSFSLFGLPFSILVKVRHYLILLHLLISD